MADRTVNFARYDVIHHYICALNTCGKKFICVHKNLCYCTSECQVKAKQLGILVFEPIVDNPIKNDTTAHNWTIFDNDYAQGEVL